MKTAYIELPEVTITRTRLVIPAFSYSVIWTGTSQMLVYYEIGNKNYISLKRSFDNYSNFILAISDGNNRYGLWPGSTFIYPIYKGETLGPHARIEVWSAGDFSAESSEDIEIEASELNFPTTENTTRYITLIATYPVEFP